MNTPPPTTPQTRWDFDRVFRLLLTVAVLIGLFALVRHLSDVLIPFAVALLLAYLLNPIVNALDSRLNRRTLSVFITVIGCGVVAFALTLVLFYVGGKEIASLRDLVQQFVRSPSMQDVEGAGQAFRQFVDEQENPFIKSMLEEFQASLGEENVEELEISVLVKKAVSYVAPGLVGVLTGTLSFLLGLSGLVVVMLYLVFLLI
ncbi:MAG: AI-2E family transporter, partial [Planctomycetes bacterium]|nr:AI-2E family transporter [Planctomycetota bacterium]